MASSATHNALDIPIYGAAFNVPLVWLDADGDPTLPVSLDIEVSKDNGTFANASNSAVLAKEVGGVTDSAYGYLTLTASEMTCDLLLGQAKDSTQKATPFTLRPKRLPVVRDNQCAGGGNSTATLDANASAVDDYYNGCILYLDADTGAGQARRILSYVGSTKVATVAGTWATNPDATTDYQVLATPEWLTALNVRLLAVTNANSVLLDATQVAAIATAVLAADWSSLEAGAKTATTLGGAIALIRAAVAGRIAISGTTLTVYEADGTTVIATHTIASDYSTRSTPA
jgi:hypothetical protein